MYLPGDLLPSGTYRLNLNLPYTPTRILLVDPYGESIPANDGFTVQVEEPRYLRIDMENDGALERPWASPFFPL